MSDQQTHWNDIYCQSPERQDRTDPSPFARECASLIPPTSTILELGCGLGQDAAFFASSGHTVYATDFSDVAIAANLARYADLTKLTFRVLNTTQPFPFDTATFDVVYAHLSLHYFTDTVTRRVFAEIHRVLHPGGLLTFACKSTRDPLYGQGDPIEPNMFERNGHVRHFFTEDYTRACLAADFDLLRIESGTERHHDHPSAFVKVVARCR